MKRLAAFDFDHTIIDDNSDKIVRNLISKEQIPSEVARLHKRDGWTSYMQAIFELLYKHGVNENAVRNAVEGIKPNLGMCDLIKRLSEDLNYDVIIISDSNTYFIECWLQKYNLNQNVFKIFTNPAVFVNGLLNIEMYHLQSECSLSTKNLCKGMILDEFIETRRLEDVLYDKIVYVGDGMNDFCPILRLNEGDLACVRDGFKCAELVKLTKNKKPIDNTLKIYVVKSDVLVWTNGIDISNKIKTLC